MFYDDDECAYFEQWAQESEYYAAMRAQEDEHCAREYALQEEEDRRNEYALHCTGCLTEGLRALHVAATPDRKDDHAAK